MLYDPLFTFALGWMTPILLFTFFVSVQKRFTRRKKSLDLQTCHVDNPSCAFIGTNSYYEETDDAKSVILLNRKLLPHCSEQEIRTEIKRLLEDKSLNTSDYQLRLIALERALRLFDLEKEAIRVKSSRLTVYALGEMGLRMCSNEDLVIAWEKNISALSPTGDQTIYADVIEKELVRRGLIA